MRALGVVALLLCACKEDFSDPIGEVWLETVGGWCDTGCGSTVVYRDGDQVQMHRRSGEGDVTYEAFGTLTAAGLEEFRAGSAEVSAALPSDFDECAPVDGIDIVAVLDDGQMQWEETYCVGREVEPALQRVDVFLDAVLDALRSCTSTDHIEVSGC